MKECPFCKAKVPKVAHYCASCGKLFGTEDTGTEAKSGPAAGVQIETRYVPGHAGIAILKIAGNCDQSEVRKLNLELATLRDDNPNIVIVDLSGADRLCSMALSALIAFVSDREDERENSTAVVNIGPSVRQVLECLGVGLMLPVFDTIPDALHALAAS